MATIQSILQIQDNMSRAFQPITNSLNILISGFESLEGASSNAIDTASLEAARRELNQAEAAFDEIEQEIRQADQAQQGLNKHIRDGSNAAGNLLGRVTALAGAYLSLRSIGEVIQLSDQMTNIEARLNLVIDSMPVVENVSANLALDVDTGGLNEVEQLQKQIFDAAQRSYAPYAQTADLVGKIGMNAKDAFSNTTEVVAFAELLNKQFGIAGTNAEGVSSATLQLTQALGSGVLRGEELNSVFEAAPNIIHTIADYLGEPIGRIREMAAEGELTSDVVKNAMFAAADGINEKFNSMPLTFEQIWTEFQNNAMWAFKDVLKQINNIANSDRFAEFRKNAGQSLQTIATLASHALSTIAAVGAFVYDNWSLIAPVLGTVTVATTLYLGIIIALKTASLLAATWQGILAVRTAGQAAAAYMATGATFAQTAAQYGLNAALYACPITWIILAIIALIGILYLAVAVVNRFADESYSATGIIAGLFALLAASIYNRIALVWNVLASFWEFFANVGKDRVYAVKRLFYNLASSFLDYAISMTSGWDTFATNFVNAIIGAVNGAIRAWNWFVDLLPDDVAAKVGIGKGTEFTYRTSITSDLQGLKGTLGDWVGEAPADYWEAPKMEMKSLGDAWDTGYNWGANLFGKEEKESEENKDPFKDILENVKGVQDALDDASDSGKDTAGNTAKMADKMEATEEDLKYLRDLAEQETINRFTTAEIKIEMNNENHINSEMDIDGIVHQVTEKLEEAMEAAAEGADE